MSVVTYKICGAMTRSGEPCKGKPMRNGRCRVHGGKTPVGSLAGNYKHGRYSKYAPASIIQIYENSINDPEILQLTDEIALLDGRIADRLQALDKKEAANVTWKGLQSLWKDFMFAIRSGNAEEQQKLLPVLNNFIQTGSSEADIWYELMNLIDNRRKLVDSEGRRLEIKQNILTVEQAFFIVNAIVSAMKEVVYRHADPQTARAIIVDASVEHKRLIGARETPG